MRTWLYNLLNDNVSVPGGIYENSDFNATTGIPAEKPFIVYSMGTITPEIKDDNKTLINNSIATIWVHSAPGDYLPIEALINEIRDLLEASYSTEIICAVWLNDSDDLKDPDMGTIMRYTRFQLIHKQ